MSLTISRHDSPLGCWTQAEYRPARLAGMVERIWHFEGVTAHSRERAFPNGLLELIVQLGEPYRIESSTQSEACAAACIGGIYARPFVVEAPARPAPVLGLRLRPAGAYAVLGRPLSDLGELTVDLGDVVGRAAAELTERCHAAAGAEERLRLVARWVEEGASRSPGVHPGVAWAAATIERQAGAVSIARLQEESGLTRSRFAAAFREQIGATPKLYARIQRFHRALTRLGEGVESLADLSLAAGYYDQPHMNAEFRELAGLSPTEYLAAFRYPGSVSLAEAS